MIDRGYWQHAGGDRIWAGEIEDGRPVKCAGPLDTRSAAQILDQARLVQHWPASLLRLHSWISAARSQRRRPRPRYD